MKDMNITDLKALYDFSVVHADIKIQTSNNQEAQVAKHQRDMLYEELVKRLIIETSK